MEQSDVVRRAATECELSNAAVKKVLEAIVGQIHSGLVEDGRVRIADLGIFKVADRAPRMVRSDFVDGEMEVPAHKAVTFRPVKRLKKLVNQ